MGIGNTISAGYKGTGDNKIMLLCARRCGIGVLLPTGARDFSSPQYSNRVWGPLNFLSNGYWKLFPRE
jgi:hypothetical protein